MKASFCPNGVRSSGIVGGSRGGLRTALCFIASAYGAHLWGFARLPPEGRGARTLHQASPGSPPSTSPLRTLVADTTNNETLLVAISEDDFAGMCETFCEKCGQLRLWVRREYPTKCGGCEEPNPLVGGVGGRVLPMAREQWRAARGLVG